MVTFSARDEGIRIDHPLDPKGEYLVHASVESGKRLDLYSGTIRLDPQGQAASNSLIGSLRSTETSATSSLRLAPPPRRFTSARDRRLGRVRIAGGPPDGRCRGSESVYARTRMHAPIPSNRKSRNRARKSAGSCAPLLTASLRRAGWTIGTAPRAPRGQSESAGSTRDDFRLDGTPSPSRISGRHSEGR